MAATRGRARDYPYYKVQSRDPKLSVWRDHRREAFDLLADAVAYRAGLPAGTDSRIVEWRKDGAYALTNDVIAEQK